MALLTADVLVAGDLFLDLIMSGFDCWPQPGQEVFAKELRREAGGGAAITACGLAKLGSRAAVFGVAGNDEAGNCIAERLRERGVETSALLFDSGMATALSVAVSTPRERTFFTFQGANKLLGAALDHAVGTEAFAHIRHVHLA